MLRTTLWLTLSANLLIAINCHSLCALETAVDTASGEATFNEPSSILSSERFEKLSPDQRRFAELLFKKDAPQPTASDKAEKSEGELDEEQEPAPKKNPKKKYGLKQFFADWFGEEVMKKYTAPTPAAPRAANPSGTIPPSRL